MRVCLDSIIFQLQDFGGISTYWKELSRGLRRFGDLEITEVIESAPVLWRRYARASVSEGDIFHSSYYRICRKKGRSPAIVITVYDCIYERYRKGLPSAVHRWQKRRALQASDAIITISESTKKDLQYFYPSELQDKPCFTIPLGVSVSEQSSLENMTPKLLNLSKSNFLLYVGQRAGYKNFRIILDLANTGFFKKEGLLVYCVGGSPPRADEKMEGVLFLRDISPAELQFLYSKAFALVYPSFYEGFGLPILEAMAAGCPVISSNRSSLPEVGGSACKYFDPESVEELIVQIEELFSEEERKRMRQAGYLRVAEFSWEKTVERTVDLYRSFAP